MNPAQAIFNSVDELMAPKYDRLGYLKDRWQDEKEYEDFNDYADEMKKLVPEGWTFVKASKSPFGFQMKNNDANFLATLKVSSRDVRISVQETRP